MLQLHSVGTVRGVITIIPRTRTLVHSIWDNYFINNMPSSPPLWLQNLTPTMAIHADYWPPRNTNAEFDWNIPTNEAYQHQDTHQFQPKFASARQQLDYDYHRNPFPHRQDLQDAILSRVVDDTEKDSHQQKQQEEHATIVFTAGPMGVGKGYVLANLHKVGLFPLHAFLKIDPDMIKSELPEMAGYLREDSSSAATKLHRESTQMSDVLLEYALNNQVSVIVDGSLRDTDYYEELFDRIHEQYPKYRIVILHVTADEEIIYDRAKRRAEQTGRTVPTDLLEESIRQVPRSVEILSKRADRTFTISNNENEPMELKTTLDEDDDRRSHSAAEAWAEFATYWGGKQQKQGEQNKTCSLTCRMSSAWGDEEAHEAARAVWGKAYPNFCPRCAMCDKQCGICIHNIHQCACEQCR